MLKNKLVLWSVLAAAAVAARADEPVPASPEPRGGQLGVGVNLGDPIGGSFRYLLTKNHAIDAGVGVSDETTLYAGYLWSAWGVTPQPPQGRLGLHLGLGGRIEDRRDTEFGLRTAAGVDYRLAKYPVELGLEVAPVFRMTPRSGTHVDWVLGVRYYFGTGG